MRVLDLRRSIDHAFKTLPVGASVNCDTRAVMFHIGRCGSTVVTDMLNQHRELLWDGELFDGPGRIASPHLKPKRWHRWYNSVHFPTAPYDYIDERVRKTRCKMYGFEMTVFQLEHNQIDVNDFADSMARLGFGKYMLLTRKNYLRWLVSCEITLRTAVFHRSAKATPELVKIAIDPERLFGRSDMPLLRLFQIFDDYERDLTRILERQPLLRLNYEEDIQDNPLNAYGKACEFLAISPKNVAIRYGKTTPFPLKEVLTNFEEIASLLRGTRWEWMLSS